MTTQVAHRTVKIDGLDIFYREAGPKDAPTILLLHGFPTSSHMFRNLIPALADSSTSSPPTTPASATVRHRRSGEFDYTFDKLAEGRSKLHREGRADEVRPLRPGLRGSGRLPAGGRSTRSGSRP